MKLLFMPLLFLAVAFFSAAQDTTKKDIPALINNARDLRALMQLDPHRPIYHFVAPEGHAMPFDPNGAIYWKGKYHLGYIYQKYRAGKYEHVWGHAVSTDLFHWTLYPDMLNIQDGDLEQGIFSGGTFLSKEGIPHIMYHGQGANANMVAYSKDDDLKAWKKFEGNPVLKTPASDDPFGNSGKYTAWDPEGWYDQKAGCYYQISGGKKPALFKSKDMYAWEHIGPLLAGNKKYLYESEDVSCPDFFSIGNKSMLLFISHNIGAQYFTGTFANDHFSIERHGRMNWPGGTFFAPEQLKDDKGRNIIWGWVLERKPKHFKDYGWSGIMSLPRVLSLGKNNTLQILPPKEVEAIRTDEVKEENIIVPAGAEKELRAKGTSLEIKLEMNGGPGHPYGVKVFCSPDGKEETVISYDPVKKNISINFIKSSVDGPVTMPASAIFPPQMDGFPENVSEQTAPFALEAGEPLQLDIFIDRSVIEVFANGRQCITQVVYPQLENSTRIKVFSGGEKLMVKKAQVFTMAATNAY
ncbi:MAG: glycoside hydrolase family 32 protein [Chitinophagaceae bacterium]|nr:glycoside hydrolase family 32 protein [Chitinophagaceae bacterium]